MIRAVVAVVFSLLPTLAFAHVGFGDTHGLSHGFMHPLSGIDHILAMVGVGIFAAHLGERAIWLVPLAFVSMMGLSGAAGMAGWPLPFVETGIGVSIVGLGLLIALEISLPVDLAAIAVGFFAIFHGHAHGAEMPRSASGLAYGIGFIAATALLHLGGVGIGMALQARSTDRFAKLIGGAMALAGLGVMAGAF